MTIKPQPVRDYIMDLQEQHTKAKLVWLGTKDSNQIATNLENLKTGGDEWFKDFIRKNVATILDKPVEPLSDTKYSDIYFVWLNAMNAQDQDDPPIAFKTTIRDLLIQSQKNPRYLDAPYSLPQSRDSDTIATKNALRRIESLKNILGVTVSEGKIKLTGNEI